MANAKIVNTPSQAIPQDDGPHTQHTVGSSAGTLSSSLTLQPHTTHVLLQFNDATARVTFDGSTTPTASVGFRYVTGTNAYWTRQMFNAANAIREGGTDVVVEIQELNFI
jgi:hypothetical protein